MIDNLITSYMNLDIEYQTFDSVFGDQPKYAPWSQAERVQLYEATRMYVDAKGEIMWNLVHNVLSLRTLRQCKSFYQNVLKDQFNIVKTQYHQWTDDELFTLSCLIVISGTKKWAKVSSTYFPKLSYNQTKTTTFSIQQMIQTHKDTLQKIIQMSLLQNSLHLTKVEK